MAAEQDRPSQATWRRLYQAAIAYKETACWDWMLDSDIFGVKDPLSGEIGYCCILGAAREVFGMGVYRGTEGLDVYLRLLSRQTGGHDPDFFFIQRCLMADFHDRDHLDKADYQVIRSLGLKFRGRNAWPQFRSYLPGYFPWHLTEAEASFLAVALEQALDVAPRFRGDPALLDSPTGETYLVRTARQKEGHWVWQDEWLEPEPPEEEELSFEPLDEKRLASIAEAVSPSDEIWEGDFFYLGTPVKEEGRPFFPRMFVWADGRTGFIFGHDLSTPNEPITPLRESLIELLKKCGVVPRTIRVRKQEAVELLAPLAASLKIKLVKARTLRAVDAFRRGLPDYRDSIS